MNNTRFNILNFVRFKQIDNWSVSHILGQRIGFNRKYSCQPIGNFVKRNSTTIIVQNDIQYKQVTLKAKGGGAVLRDIKKGKDIGTKKQFVVSEGQFIMSKIDARNGAFGVVPKDLDGAIVTADFPVYNVVTDVIDPEYFALVSSTNAFARFAQSCSRGTTNRQRIDINLFLSQQIPTPALVEQESLVKAYKEKIQQAAELERQAKEVESNIEDYLLAELGIKPQPYTIPEPSLSIASEPQVEYTTNHLQNADVSATYHWGDEIKKEYKYLKFVSYKDIDRWDCYNSEPKAISRLKQSCFPVVEIGKAYNFIKRSWDKKEKEFRYVEIGSVDTLNGIMYAEKIPTSKAPSRATQKITTGDLIIGTTRPYLKKFAIVDEEYDDCVCSSGFQVIALNEAYNLPFLYEYLKSPVAIAQFELFMTGALYPAITTSDLKKVLIPLPPLESQNAIVEHINKQKARIKELKKTSRGFEERGIGRV